MNKKNKAFTLIELIISITITVVILGGLMIFISSVYNEINYSIKKTNSVSKITEIENKIREINSLYSSGIILIDNENGTGSDVLLFRKESGEVVQDGYIFAQINFNTKYIDGSGNVDFIDNKMFGYRKISESELIDLDSDPSKVYDYTFHLDNIFKGVILKDFQVEFYNSGKIGEIEISTFLNYDNKKIIKSYKEIDNNEIEKFIFNF